MLEGCQAISLSQPDLNHSNRNRLLRGTRGASGPFLKTKKCPNHFNRITRLSVSTSNKILQYVAGKPQYTWENGKLYVECKEKKLFCSMSHLYHWQKKQRLFLQKFGEHKQSKLLTLPYCVCCIAAFCRLRLRRFTTHKGGGELLQGGFCRSTWTNILAIEKILHDNIKNIYKILQGNIHKQRQSKIHKEKDIDNWCNRQI